MKEGEILGEEKREGGGEGRQNETVRLFLKKNTSDD